MRIEMIRGVIGDLQTVEVPVGAEPLTFEFDPFTGQPTIYMLVPGEEPYETHPVIVRIVEERAHGDRVEVGQHVGSARQYVGYWPPGPMLHCFWVDNP